MQHGIHSLESHQCSHELVGEQTLCQGWLPCSAIHSSRPARVMGDGESRLPSARALVTDQKSEVKEHSGKLQGHTLLLVLSRSFCGGLPTLHMHDSSHVTLTKLKAP